MSVPDLYRLLLAAFFSLLVCTAAFAQEAADASAVTAEAGVAAVEAAKADGTVAHASDANGSEAAATDEAFVPQQVVPDAVIVVGAPGTPEYAESFAAAAAEWRQAFEAAGLRYCTIGGAEKVAEESEAKDEAHEGENDVAADRRSEAPDDKTLLLERLSSWAGESEARRWIVLTGHGTSNRQGANFNLVGPDMSDIELRDALAGGGPTVVVCGFSSSGGWVPALAAPDRIVIAATKGPEEYNYSRFGGYFAAAIADAEYDLDHDLEVSLLEAFLAAARETERFYTDAGRIASEHAILDDNGDGAGTTADFYEGLEVVKPAADGQTVDGERAAGIALVPAASQPQLDAEQTERRDALEAELRELRGRKPSMAEDAYYDELERIFRQLADLYAVSVSESQEPETPEFESPESGSAEAEVPEEEPAADEPSS